MMRLRYAAAALAALALSTANLPAGAQGGSETYTATATVKTAGGATATAPVTITISRKMSHDEAAKFTAAFTRGGAAALRQALNGVSPTGSIRIGTGEPVPVRITLERVTGPGRLVTMVTDTPILHLGAGLPNAKPREGYDFGVIDIEVDAAGNGTGQLSPAARIRVNSDGAFVVEDYGTEFVRLTGVKRAK